HHKPIVGAPVAVEKWRGHHSLKWSTETDAEGRFRWDEAPDGSVLIAVGPLGDHPGKRYCRMNPHRAERTIVMREPLHIRAQRSMPRRVRRSRRSRSSQASNGELPNRPPGSMTAPRK